MKNSEWVIIVSTFNINDILLVKMAFESEQIEYIIRGEDTLIVGDPAQFMVPCDILAKAKDVIDTLDLKYTAI